MKLLCHKLKKTAVCPTNFKNAPMVIDREVFLENPLNLSNLQALIIILNGFTFVPIGIPESLFRFDILTHTDKCRK
jgi:hypothetical protein